MNLLKDEVSTLVRKLAIPASIGTLFQTLYTIVDTFYAGKISPEALSALSKSFPIFFIIIATSIGVTVAGTSLGRDLRSAIRMLNGSCVLSEILFSWQPVGATGRPHAGPRPAAASKRREHRQTHRHWTGAKSTAVVARSYA